MPDQLTVSLVQTVFAAILGLVIWMLQRQITQAAQRDQENRKAVLDSIQGLDTRLREAEINIQKKVDRDELDDTVGRAIKPVERELAEITRQLWMLNEHLLKGGR